MSTRATYQIEISLGSSVTFYVHHDGYPEGAASYFHAAICHHATGRGSLADSFLRANDGAELTPGHSAHGDTEYRYTVDRELKIRAEKVDYDGNAETFYYGPLLQFVNKYSVAFGCDPLYQPKGRRYMTLTMIEKARDEAVEKLEAYKAAHPTMAGNIHWMESEVQRWEDALEDAREQIVGKITEESPL